MQMDPFDNQVNLVSKEIFDIKSHIDTIKSKNAKTMKDIINSISSLTNLNKHKSFFKKEESNDVLVTKENFNAKRMKQRKNHSSFSVKGKFPINYNMLEDEPKYKKKKIFTIQLTEPAKEIRSKNSSRNFENTGHRHVKELTQKIDIFNSPLSDANRLNDNKGKIYSPLSTENSMAYIKRKVNSMSSKGNSDYTKAIVCNNSRPFPLLKQKNNHFTNMEYYSIQNANKEPNYKEILNRIIFILNQKTEGITSENVIEYIKDITLNKDYVKIYKKQNIQICQCSKFEIISKNNNLYENFVKDIMGEYEIQSLNELKLVIQDSLDKKDKNERFVNGMRKILCGNYIKSDYHFNAKPNANNNEIVNETNYLNINKASYNQNRVQSIERFNFQ